jgi:tetratricopeptide (TPR) repeat protein
MRIKRILLGIIFGLLVPIFAISCQTKPEESDTERQRTVNDIGQRAITDTTNMDEIQGVPVIQAPGAQIDRDKVTAILNEQQLSFKEITNPDATEEDINESIEQLNNLLATDQVGKDAELEYVVHNILGSTYLRLYQKKEEVKYLNQAEKHLDTAISMFNNQPEYKADLADAYTGKLSVYSLRGEQDKITSLLKKLIEEYQNIGYGLYKNWFASRQVEKMYHMIRMDSLTAQEVQETVDYLIKMSNKFENEVGITAQMVLANHYATNGEHEKANRLVQKVEKRLESLDNEKFEEQKWKRYRTQIKSTQQRAGQSFSKADSDTLFYEISSEMIDQAVQSQGDREQPLYYVDVQLKSDYHSEFAQKTTDNIGNFMAIVHNGEIISSSFPTIQTGISNGRFSLGPYEKQKEAKKVLRRITDAD